MKPRRYTADEIDATALRPAGDGDWEVVLAGDVIGHVRHRYVGGRRQGWEATTVDLMRLSHRGDGTYARTRQAALVDLLLGLDIRPT